MAKYGKKAREWVARALHKLKRGKLISGSGAEVKTREQAIAIGLSEARRAGVKVPKKPEDPQPEVKTKPLKKKS